MNFLDIKRAILFCKENISFDKKRIKSSFLLLIFIFLIQNLFFISFFIWVQSLDFLQKKSDLVLEIKEGILDYQVKAFIQWIEKKDWITKIIYKNKKEEFKSFWKKHPDITNFLEKNNIKSPIPWVIEIYSKNIFTAKNILNSIKNEENYSIINQSEIILNEDLNKRIEKLSDFVWFILSIWVLFFIIILFIIFFTILNILKLSINHHKNDIKIFEYLWALKSFIKLPYYFEAFYLLFFAFILSILIILVVILLSYFIFPWILIFLWWLFSNFTSIFIYYIFYVLIFIIFSSFFIINSSINKYLTKI